MADAAPGENSSTPTTAATASVTAPATADQTPPATATTASAVAATDTTPSTAKLTPATTDSTPATAATTADTATTEPTATAQPAFTLPTDMTLAPEAVEKFTGFIKAKAPGADGKFALTAQELVDTYATLARDANTRWQTQVAAQDSAWAAESKARFTAPQLAAAETGVGFLTSYEPEFRALAQSYRNNPAFVNAMRVIGERLSEDTFEIAGAAAAPAKRSRKDLFYGPKTATN